MSKCPAIGCETHTASTKFMCHAHWYMVPPYLRRQIWALYRSGKAMSATYCEVAQGAIRAVAAREGKAVTGEERELRLYQRLPERRA